MAQRKSCIGIKGKNVLVSDFTFPATANAIILAGGKPVLADVDIETMKICYEELPPLLNCKTENEIYSQLVKATDKQYRNELGTQARAWIMKYHHWEKVIDLLNESDSVSQRMGTGADKEKSVFK